MSSIQPRDSIASHGADVPDEKPTVQQDVDDDEEYTLAEQRKIIHKVDRRLLIILGAMQAVSFLDRANMSNAAIAGMTEDLELGVGSRYVCTHKPPHQHIAYTTADEA